MVFKDACCNGVHSVLVASHGAWIYEVHRWFKERNIDGLPDPAKTRPKFGKINTGITKLKLMLDEATCQVISGQCLLDYSGAHLKNE